MLQQRPKPETNDLRQRLVTVATQPVEATQGNRYRSVGLDAGRQDLLLGKRQGLVGRRDDDGSVPEHSDGLVGIGLDDPQARV
ncbi:MAG: hypothetical protein AB7O92_23125 [Acidimicrobiia bacterium]